VEKVQTDDVVIKESLKNEGVREECDETPDKRPSKRKCWSTHLLRRAQYAYGIIKSATK